jgi:transposase-like protein
MKACPHCSGARLVRNGVYRGYKRADHVGIRYLCRDCGRTHMVRVTEKADIGYMKRGKTLPSGGRPTRMDWRFA